MRRRNESEALSSELGGQKKTLGNKCVEEKLAALSVSEEEAPDEDSWKMLIKSQTSK